ncbi:MAG: hypothetical protein AB7N91_24785 [Candidatus Tectimicrobiota bacterium]
MPRRLLQQTQESLAPDEALVTDRGLPLAQIQAAGIVRDVSPGATNFTARRACLPAYRGKGRRPTKGPRVRPLPRTSKGRTLAATPPDRCETWQGGTLEAPSIVSAQFWDTLGRPGASPGTATFTTGVIHDPRFAEPLLLNTPLALSGAQVQAMYPDRWAVEGLPLWAKQMLGAVRQFVFAPTSRQRLPELALLAGSILADTAATQPALPTGFWDRTRRTQPLAGCAGCWPRYIFQTCRNCPRNFGKNSHQPRTGLQAYMDTADRKRSSPCSMTCRLLHDIPCYRKVECKTFAISYKRPNKTIDTTIPADLDTSRALTSIDLSLFFFGIVGCQQRRTRRRA